jgi:hypothetical protein
MLLAFGAGSEASDRRHFHPGTAGTLEYAGIPRDEPSKSEMGALGMLHESHVHLP